MRLYLMRHGEANSPNKDPQRGLSARGVREVEKVAERLSAHAPRVQAIWHSGKARAAQTAEIIARTVSAEQGVTARAGLAPDDPIEPMREEMIAATDDLMLVGHLPFLGKLASALVAADEWAGVVSFGQATCACLERDEKGSWRVNWVATPDLLG